MMSDIAIKVQNISKRYRITSAKHRHNTLRDVMMDSLKSVFRRNGESQKGTEDIWALRDVSLEIKRGEIVGIIGGNGAGKSTLLKIISRITEATHGRAEIYGRVGSLLEVGTGFSLELSGRENVYLNGAILGMKKKEIDQKFDAIVEFAEIGKFIDTPVKRYSSGMYVRLAFAVSAHLEPEIMLIDEVLSVGDLAFQRKCMDHAKRLLDNNATVLFVSHNMFTIKAMCNRTIFLSHGQVLFDGSTAEAIQLYEEEGGLSSPSWALDMIGPESSWPIHVTDIHLLDMDNQPRKIFDYGERMRIRLEYEAFEKIASPNFIVAFVRSDNVACCNFNTAMDGFVINSIDGEGSIELVTPPLMLVSERYNITILVRDITFQRLYCVREGTSFHIRHDFLNTHFGVYHEKAEWHWSTLDQKEY